MITISNPTESSEVVKELLTMLKDIHKKRECQQDSLEFYIHRRLDDSYKAYEEELDELVSSLLYFESFRSKDKIIKGI